MALKIDFVVWGGYNREENLLEAVVESDSGLIWQKCENIVR